MTGKLNCLLGRFVGYTHPEEASSPGGQQLVTLGQVWAGHKELLQPTTRASQTARTGVRQACSSLCALVSELSNLMLLIRTLSLLVVMVVLHRGSHQRLTTSAVHSSGCLPLPRRQSAAQEAPSATRFSSPVHEIFS